MHTANKGEWSEIYALLKILGDKKIYAGDENLNKVSELFYPIFKVLRSENSKNNYEYKITQNIIEITGKNLFLCIPVEIFKEKAAELFNHIISGKGTFSIPSIEDFLHKIFITKIKASSRNKTDITMVIHDLRTCSNHLLGFSIKSQIGGASTLLNASKDNTNFVFEIPINKNENIEAIQNEINNQKTIKEKMIYIREHYNALKFINIKNNIFYNNLTLIDTGMPEIAANLIKLYFSTKISSIKELTKKLNKLNPLNFDMSNSHPFYEAKVKKLLVDTALGMMPSSKWEARYDATGGYIIVKKDGELICYHIYEKNKFEDYLFNNTKFETPSTKRHNFGTAYINNGSLYINLNLQIRFK